MLINIYQALQNFSGSSKQLNCKGLLFTNYDCPQPTRKQKFLVECNFIAYVLSGRRVFHKSNNNWDLREGTCVFVKKGTHIAEKEGAEGWCVMVFFMPDSFLKQFVAEHRNHLPLNSSHSHTDHVVPLDVNELSKSFFYSMLPYFTQSPPPPESLLELKFKELLLSLLTNKKNSCFISVLNSLLQEQPSLEEIMQDNFTYNLTLADYAKLSCRSLPTFKREFRKIFNDSPAKWVARKRLDLAAQLLENSSLSISDISYECGFENQTHFSRVFHEKMGMAPLQYRRNGSRERLVPVGG